MVTPLINLEIRTMIFLILKCGWSESDFSIDRKQTWTWFRRKSGFVVIQRSMTSNDLKSVCHTQTWMEQLNLNKHSTVIYSRLEKYHSQIMKISNQLTFNPKLKYCFSTLSWIHQRITTSTHNHTHAITILSEKIPPILSKNWAREFDYSF